MRCVLPGQERPPRTKKEGAFKVSGGEGRPPLTFQSCPVGTVLTEEAIRYLTAYNYFKTFHEWPPGRRDPRLVSAFFVLEGESNSVEGDRIKALAKEKVI